MIYNVNTTFEGEAMTTLFPLAEWFDVTKKINRQDVQDCVDQMAHYAQQDGQKPHGAEWQKTVALLKAAVKQHNAPFIDQEQCAERVESLARKIAILKGIKKPKSASQHHFFAKAKREGLEETLARIEHELAEIHNK